MSRAKRVAKSVQIAAIVLLLAAPPLTAQGRWVTVADDGTAVVSVDTASVRKAAGDLYAIWIQFKYSKAQTLADGKRYHLLKTHVYVNCQDQTMGTGASYYYNTSGNVIASFPDYGASATMQEPPVPDTYGETVVKSFCDIQRGYRGP